MKMKITSVADFYDTAVAFKLPWYQRILLTANYIAKGKRRQTA